ncbi:MAG: hypothetical protein NXY57DRAFT_963337 [Lentinula lateritia]|nr:MAG: hypothetical protein NXY57DRAFT_963337 [Lentinula lateritia]
MSDKSSSPLNSNWSNQTNHRQARFEEESTLYLHEITRKGGSVGNGNVPHPQSTGGRYPSSLDAQPRRSSTAMSNRDYAETQQRQLKDQSYGRLLHPQYQSLTSAPSHSSEPRNFGNFGAIYASQVSRVSATGLPPPPPKGMNVVSLPDTGETSNPRTWRGQVSPYQSTPRLHPVAFNQPPPNNHPTNNPETQQCQTSPQAYQSSLRVRPVTFNQPLPNTFLTSTSTISSFPAAPEGMNFHSLPSCTRECNNAESWRGRASPHHSSPIATSKRPTPQTPVVSAISLPDVDEEDKTQEERESRNIPN